MKPIYKPAGAAGEYANLAINIYTGCPHGCTYCYVPGIIRRSREKFHTNVRPRENIVEEVQKQIKKEQIRGKLIHLCFTCDPYPTGYDCSPTREIIKTIKQSGNHVQILTKGDGSRDMDLLDENDWYGTTITCTGEQRLFTEPNSIPTLSRLENLEKAKKKGIKTWISFEPVISPDAVISCIIGYFDWFDKIMIGKLNHHKSDTDWAAFGRAIENVCKETGVDYYIKDSLREEMKK